MAELYPRPTEFYSIRVGFRNVKFKKFSKEILLLILGFEPFNKLQPVI